METTLTFVTVVQLIDILASATALALGLLLSAATLWGLIAILFFNGNASFNSKSESKLQQNKEIEKK